ncbi:nucleoside hydrolase [Streptomyces sp. NPDC051016]|uniref:nucleoside hydrolase n=1 Tax=Streptomyces sp. NPDC051016 TaxID=3365638 RepID=UPI00379A0911
MTTSVTQAPSYAFPTRTKAILDTDIGYLNDDSIALAVLLGSPEVDLLGVSVVAGNFDHDQEVIDGLSMLERLGRTDVPLWRGAKRPLVHDRGRYHEGCWGGFATYEETTYPLGRPPAVEPAPLYSPAAISEAAHKYPGEVTIFAIGPLTNIAVALSADPELAELLRGIVIMGGAIAGLPNGAGNVTPTSEFNFWVDPEAAAIVLRSGAPILTVPLNVCRPVSYTEKFHQEALKGSGPGVDLLEERMRGVFDSGTDDGDVANFSHYGLTDSTAVIAGLRPELGTVERLTFQIDLSHGPAYGTSYTYRLGNLMDAKIADAPGVWDAMVQPARLDGAVSDPVEVDVCVSIDPDGVRAQCVRRLTSL